MDISRSRKESLYEQLYTEIKQAILAGRITDGTKLPSKRAQAERLGISVVTVENAYAQLLAEGYITARERSGYYVCAGEVPGLESAPAAESAPTEQPDLPPEQLQPEVPASSSGGNTPFPFSVWTRLMRSVILEKGSDILAPVPPGGAPELQRAISAHLKSFRGINVPPERIIVGAGTEYLNNLLVQLLGKNLTYAVENPGYHKTARIYRLNGALCLPISLDGQGICAEQLYYNNVDAAHISPAHHFPTGIVMPISRRLELMKWASRRNGYIIEDDYDSEFRWSGRPVPTMFELDTSGRVIYMNTFSMTIAPSVRIGYICLPSDRDSSGLFDLWKERLGFCSCPVPAFEQYTLARFISEGHFERHISRMRKHYRRVRELTLALAQRYSRGNADITEENSGLHFLMKIPVSSPLPELFAQCGVKLSPLTEYYDDDSDIPDGIADCFVVNYKAADAEKLELMNGQPGN
ncbi:MAG: PLP-dependent aminotransferase family protein [Oscillospiraceae bacterium]